MSGATVALLEGAGCFECGGTGFRGRSAIHELLDLTDRIREMILDKRPTSEIKRAAKEDGMTFLRDSAVDKVRLGITTLQGDQQGHVHRITHVSVRQDLRARKGTASRVRLRSVGRRCRGGPGRRDRIRPVAGRNPRRKPLARQCAERIRLQPCGRRALSGNSEKQAPGRSTDPAGFLRARTGARFRQLPGQGRGAAATDTVPREEDDAIRRRLGGYQLSPPGRVRQGRRYRRDRVPGNPGPLRIAIPGGAVITPATLRRPDWRP